MDNNLVLTPEERLLELSDSIIKGILGRDDLSKEKRKVLFSQLAPDIFRDENHIIYKVFYNFKDRGIVPDEEFISMYLLRNEKIVTSASEYININAFSEVDENPVVGYVSAVVDKYRRLANEESDDDIDIFNLNIEKYKVTFKSLELDNVYSQARTILDDGVSIGRKTLQGYDDSVSFVKSKVAALDGLVDGSLGQGFVDASEEGLKDDEKLKTEKVADFGEIDELNAHLGGVYTPLFYSVLAPSKGGKSKFCTNIIHNAVVEYGTNVVVWPHEGGYKAWLAQIRARHYDYIYNKGVTDVSQLKRGVSQKIILENAFKNDSIRALEQASRIDLFSNPSYGNIHFIDRPFLVETVLDELDTAVQLNNAKIVLIDYLQLIGSSKNMKKNERIGEAYQKILGWQKKRNVAVISPAQFTQEFMKTMLSAQDSNKDIDVRLGGGESAEIIRTPDINLALYATPEDLIRRDMKFLSVPSRFCEPFTPFNVYIDLAVSKFSSVRKISV